MGSVAIFCAYDLCNQSNSDYKTLGSAWVYIDASTMKGKTDEEDECFDLNNITSLEIRQFPNLKEATIMSSNFDKVKEIFEAENIDVELL